RAQRLKALSVETRPVVLFEAPHRVRETLEDLVGAVPQRRVCAAREITKKFEEIRIDTPSGLLEWFREPRGEFTLVVEGGEPAAQEAPPLDDFLHTQIAAGLGAREAAAAAVEALGVNKRIAYQRYLELRALK
ncbi:MAG: SAM-dependent methyltransferase, partial [Candidatus Xenobia bacterium]